MASHKDISIVYMGTPDFAVEPLRAILDVGFNVVAVVTTPDKPAGRGQKLSESAVKKFSIERGLMVLQPEKLKDSAFIDQLQELKPDIMVVVAFRMLPESVWRIPRLGTFNLHASLLPQYRGAAPINWVVINGEAKTGLTTFLIDQQIDTGNILLQEEVSIKPNETAGELHDRLMSLGGPLVLKTIEALVLGKVQSKHQDSLISPMGEIKSAPKLFKETCRIEWNKPATELHNFIRGLSPYPGAWTEFVSADGITTTAKIFRSEPVDIHKANPNPGELSTDGATYLHVNCALGTIAVKEIQLAGKRNLPIKEFLMGFRFPESLRAI